MDGRPWRLPARVVARQDPWLKIDQITQAMDVHPITLIALTYLQHAGKKERERIVRTLQTEVEHYIP